ncbi:hypothetical protein T4E_9655 [Trichinella pseudospiralis]|uniref:Uncharacterized protein n=1 Tax=Trichinella pseudospiralis TaxID=6337 RepID=A0A0V0XPV5_TRIPS|nr:hypothetical protein T4E_9655 [Trichinella pseudospiralis]
MRSNFGGRNKSKPIGYAVDWSTDTEKKQKSQQRGSAIVAYLRKHRNGTIFEAVAQYMEYSNLE